jgi:hypothetical protein
MLQWLKALLLWLLRRPQRIYVPRKLEIDVSDT